MAIKTIVIVGAGPGLGYSIARYFGGRGYRVALIARNLPKLQELVRRLSTENIDAAAFAGDVTDSVSLELALRAAEEYLGWIDVLEFSPMTGANIHVLDSTREDFQYQLNYALLAAVTATRSVLPGMKRRGSGALLFTMGTSSTISVPSHGSVGTAMAALRSYALVLSEALHVDGIYSGAISIGNLITPGGDADPDAIAQRMFEMATKREETDVIIGKPDVGALLERQMGRISAAELEAALSKQNESKK